MADHLPINRRDALLGASSALAALALPSTSAHAKSPIAGRQVASAYRIKVGDIEVTCISDGSVPLPMALFPQADKEDATRLLAQNNLAFDQSTPLSINAFLINDGNRLTLVDAGGGPMMAAASPPNPNAPAAGLLVANLAALGIKPSDIETVLLTHMHRDHAGGLITADGTAIFGSSEVVVPETEYAFWGDDSNAAKAPKLVERTFKIAKDVFAASKGRIRQIREGVEVTPGVTAISAPGHTPGHMIYRVASGKDQILLMGDMVHNWALQFARPDWQLALDTDAAQSAQSRHKVFGMAAADNLMVAGCHVNFPGAGTIRKDGAGYAFMPTPWKAAL